MYFTKHLFYNDINNGITVYCLYFTTRKDINLVRLGLMTGELESHLHDEHCNYKYQNLKLITDEFLSRINLTRRIWNS